jgi:hypothetical protein
LIDERGNGGNSANIAPPASLAAPPPVSAPAAAMPAEAAQKKSPAFAGLFDETATPKAYAQGSRNTMVWSRSGPVETIATWQPASSSSARR